MRVRISYLFLFYGAILVSGCSGGEMDTSTAPDTRIIGKASEREITQRVLWGIWDITLDPVSNCIGVLPSRNINVHFNLTNFVTPPQCDDCLGINVEGFNPDGWVYDIKVSLRNPTHLTAYDVRGTLLIGAPGDNRKLVNADDYTELFDDSTPPDRNPFKVFAKDQPGRAFQAEAVHEALYQISFPPPPAFNVKYVIDGSWPGNQSDPYEIYGQATIGDIDDKGQWPVEFVVNVADWQDDVQWVLLDITPFGYPNKIIMQHTSGDEWRAQFKNYTHIPVGEYELWIEAKSETSALHLYDKIKLNIVHNPNPAGWGHLWAGDDTSFVISRACAVDSIGNSYAGGQFNQTADFDPDFFDEENRTATQIDAYLSKFDADGDFLWVQTWGSGYCDIWEISTDYDNNVYMVGNFCGLTDFDPGPGVDEHDIDQGSMYGCYISKFDPNGNHLWTRAWGGTMGYSMSGDGYYGICCDGSENVYVTGHYYGTVDFDPGPGTDNHTSVEDGQDIFLSKFSADGEFLWVRTWGGNYSYWHSISDMETGRRVAAAGNGDVLVAGVFGGTVDFDPDDSDVFEQTAMSNYGGFVSRFDSSGDFLWVFTTISVVSGVTTDSLSNTYISKYTTNGMASLLKFLPDGELDWGQSWNVGTQGFAHDVDVDSDGNPYITGNFNGWIDFDPDPDAVDEHYSNNWSIDFFLSKFDTSGNFQWARSWGAKYTDHCYSVDVQPSGICHISGCLYSSEIDLDPGPWVDTHYNGMFGNKLAGFLIKVLDNGYW